MVAFEVDRQGLKHRPFGDERYCLVDTSGYF